MCVVETARGCWSYLCQECQADSIAKDERIRKLEAALRPFVDPASYSTTEDECRLNPAMDWCAVHSFRWPCPVDAARAAEREKEGNRE